MLVKNRPWQMASSQRCRFMGWAAEQRDLVLPQACLRATFLTRF
ncbi:hypothetical protein BLL52_0528 [Rhodoferax antarcticus ANT.BR]|uniref:Uncharacterized protein n=1 Tax=Rhodoferax antarcticus ANT.BR TaxID=1111071 RepID=A0A1Q8YK18_9BURK|nr:hypothetical protein BLL52_0528 [Rhodoferax antarcticus ANT.BR]